MTKHNIFIINFNLLYEILEEIKEHLSFEIKKYNSVDDLNIANNSDIKDCLIILNFDKKLLLKENLGSRNFLYLKDFPISLDKLIESINVNLIKIKFNHKSKIDIKGYELNLNSKFFSKKGINLKLTEKEIEIILYLNKNKVAHNVLDLQKNIWGYVSNMETHTVETHIYRLRKKINDKFNDEKFILSLKNGYFIE